MNDVETCKSCGQQKTSTTVGTITQWISTCGCEFEGDSWLDKSVRICVRCSKRIRPGREGSLTQWVFQSEFCNCQKPEIRFQEPEEKIKLKQPAFEGFKDEDTESELEIDPALFPVERYKPIEKIGEGSTGTVYLCRDRILKKRVAVKVLKSITEEQLITFQNEAKTTARLQHPYIIKVLDFGTTANSIPYMVMEHVPGSTLKQAIVKSGSLAPDMTIKIIIKIAQGLEYAHGQRVFHRDLQSNNILIGDLGMNDPDVQIVDFGLAKIKQDNQEPTIVDGRTIVGTPLYMSPDQVQGKPFDQRSEIYSLGCILFEALVGHPPYQGATALETLNMHVKEKTPSILDSVKLSRNAAALDQMVTKCLAKDPDDRFQSMSELLSNLESLLETKTPTKKKNQATIADEQLSLPGFMPGILPKDLRAETRKTNVFAIALVVIVLLSLSALILSNTIASLQHQEPARVEFMDQSSVDTMYTKQRDSVVLTDDAFPVRPSRHHR